jgi:hypothetical protein
MHALAERRVEMHDGFAFGIQYESDGLATAVTTFLRRNQDVVRLEFSAPLGEREIRHIVARQIAREYFSARVADQQLTSCIAVKNSLALAASGIQDFNVPNIRICFLPDFLSFAVD